MVNRGTVDIDLHCYYCVDMIPSTLAQTLDRSIVSILPRDYNLCGDSDTSVNSWILSPRRKLEFWYQIADQLGS